MIDDYTIKSKIKDLYRFKNDDVEITIKEYFLTFKETIPSQYVLENIDSSVLEELPKNGWYKFFFNQPIKNNSNSYDNNDLLSDTHFDRSVSFWIKDNFYLRVSTHSKGKKCYCALGFPYNEPKDKTEEVLSYLKSFSDKNNDSKFYILIKEEYGITLRDFKVNLPENINMDLNYGEGFSEKHEMIKNKIKNDNAGLFVFHGDPGCGKSTYIKNLAKELTDKKFIYVPEFMISCLNDPELIGLFLSHSNSVLVIEDAEKVIVSRDNDKSSLVSVILNISDGILSDILKIPVILTYNTKSENIDEALMRKGRLKYKHEFKKLNEKNCKKLLNHLGFKDKEIDKLKKDDKVKEEMSIADIYYLKDEIGDTKKKEESKFGFN